MVLRKPEGLSAARAFNPTRVNKYFQEIKSILPANVDPRLVFNIDETGLSTVPNDSSLVLAHKGQKTVSKIKVGERGVLTTVIPCYPAPNRVMLTRKRFCIFYIISCGIAMKLMLQECPMYF